MPITVTVPRLGWNMEEGTFIKWLKADGDAVRPGESLFQLEGEKSVEEIECFDAGRLHVPADAPKPGERVRVGAVIGYLLQTGETVPETPGPDSSQNRLEPPASPSVRRMARERGIDLASVQGSGPGGRIAPEDIRAPLLCVAAQATEKRTPAVSPRARRLATRLGIDWSKLAGSGRTGRIRERDVATAARPETSGSIVPLSPARRTIAARMVESHRTTAPVTLTSLVDATNLVNLRGQFKAAASPPIPTYTDFFVKLAGDALQKHRLLASRWTDAGLVPAQRMDIGIAVDTDVGLLVPVIRDVTALSLRQVAARARELIELARGGKLPAREMEGGGFTITNLGAFGIDAFTPIINPPETAILGVGRIDRRAVMQGDRVVGREMVTLSLTFDHRVIDGAPAARFLQTLAQLVENPGPAVIG